MEKFVVITSELPGDALVLISEYDTLQEAQEAADERIATNREGTVVYVMQVPYFSRKADATITPVK